MGLHALFPKPFIAECIPTADRQDDPTPERRLFVKMTLHNLYRPQWTRLDIRLKSNVARTFKLKLFSYRYNLWSYEDGSAVCAVCF